MNEGERLIYVTGPSGAGKDSVLQWLRDRLREARADDHLHWARRTITRAAAPLGEQHEAVDAAAFEQLARAGAFALHWRANHTSYGIRQQELAPLASGRWVLVNGSRAHCDEARARFRHLKQVHVAASEPVLRARLTARGRETPADVEQRLARNARFDELAASRPPEVRINNDGPLVDAGQALLQWLRTQKGWPA